MRKILRFFGILVVIGALGYLFFLFFVSPDTQNDPETVTISFLENIASADVCTTHFNPETVSHCESFKTAIENETFTYTLAAAGDDILVIITIGTNSDNFTFSFIDEPNTGIAGFFHSTNYYIDIIE